MESSSASPKDLYVEYIGQLSQLCISENVEEGNVFSKSTSHSPTAAETSARHDVFTVFPNLPLEIRRKIWQTVATFPRVVVFAIRYISSGIDGNGIATRSFTQRDVNRPPPVLQVSREARQEALRFYSLTFGSLRFEGSHEAEMDRSNIVEHDARVHVNFDTDTIYFSEDFGQDLFKNFNMGSKYFTIRDDRRQFDQGSLKSVGFDISEVYRSFAAPMMMLKFLELHNSIRELVLVARVQWLWEQAHSSRADSLVFQSESAVSVPKSYGSPRLSASSDAEETRLEFFPLSETVALLLEQRARDELLKVAQRLRRSEREILIRNMNIRVVGLTQGGIRI